MAQTDSFSDGPYLLPGEDGWVLHWMANNELQTAPLAEASDRFDSTIAPAFDPAYVQPDASFTPEATTRFQDVPRIVALSDVHGQFDLTMQLLQAHEIIDPSGDWSFGTGHLVLVGDIFDRGDRVTELLWFFHNLEQQATAAGGKVHVLLGNHEAMVLEGDLRYLHPKYRYTSAAFGMPYQEIVGESTYLGKWLRSKPVAITINEIAFVHAGFSPLLLSRTTSFDDINRAFREDLLDADLNEVLQDTLLNILYLDDGPLWYRGYFAEKPPSKREIKQQLRALKCDHIVVGHTSHDAIVPLYDNRVIGVDSNIKLGTSGELLIWEADRFYRASLDGKRVPLE